MTYLVKDRACLAFYLETLYGVMETYLKRQSRTLGRNASVSTSDLVSILFSFLKLSIGIKHVSAEYTLKLRVLCCSVCVFLTGQFAMVPLNLACLHCLQHSFFEHIFNLCCIYTVHIISIHLLLCRNIPI